MPNIIQIVSGRFHTGYESSLPESPIRLDLSHYLAQEYISYQLAKYLYGA